MSKLRLRIGLNRYNLIKVFCYKLEKCTGIKCVIEVGEDETYTYYDSQITKEVNGKIEYIIYGND